MPKTPIKVICATANDGVDGHRVTITVSGLTTAVEAARVGEVLRDPVKTALSTLGTIVVEGRGDIPKPN